MSADLGHGRGLGRLVDIGQDGVACALDAGQDAQPFLKPRPTVAAQAGAVSLIERCFEDERAGDFADSARHAVDVFLAFDHARSGDEHQGPAAAELGEARSSVYDGCL